jgi:DNA-directed RNA polymerase specialized sigma subunit, sigma24 homolog
MADGQLGYCGISQGVENKNIIREIRAGNVYAATNWIEERRDKLYRLVRVYADDNGLKDIFQKTLINMFDKIQGFKNENLFESWVVSLLLDECRKTAGLEASAAKVESNEISCDNMDNTMEYIRSLSSVEKDIIALKYYGGYPTEDISVILNIPVDEVRHNLYIGLKNITCLNGGTM